MVEDANEAEEEKALPESLIRQLDAHWGLLGAYFMAAGTPAADLEGIRQTIYRSVCDTGRRPGEIVKLVVWLHRGHRRPG